MNTPETINIEKYANALNALVGMDIGYLGDSDENVNAIVEVIVAAKKLENRVKELTKEKAELWEERNRIYDDLQDWKEFTEGYRKMFEDCYEEKDALIKNYAQCMKDYARDIFDDISKDSENWGSYCISAFKWGYVTTDVSKTLAKFRKKYVEGEK